MVNLNIFWCSLNKLFEQVIERGAVVLQANSYKRCLYVCREDVCENETGHLDNG